MDRERKGRPAGMRTHILVCLGASMTTMSGFFVVHTLGIESDPLRISAQVISGIGFLGVGTILITGRMHVKGLTTAAGLWTTASIGIALGAGFCVPCCPSLPFQFFIGWKICLAAKRLSLKFILKSKTSIRPIMLLICCPRRNIRSIKCRLHLREADWQTILGLRHCCGWTKTSQRRRRLRKFLLFPKWLLRWKRYEIEMNLKRRAKPSVFYKDIAIYGYLKLHCE